MKQLSLPFGDPGDDLEVLPKNTHPLPYIQVGMRLKLRYGRSKFEVHNIYEVDGVSRALCVWVSGGVAAFDCGWLRDYGWLAEAFDPSCDASEARR